MSKRRKKKVERVIHLSPGPLPARLAGNFADMPLVFSDASRLHQGGLAAILFACPTSPPHITTRSIPLEGSNTLELKAALLALGEAHRSLPGQHFALFSDNHDAVIRLQRAKADGLGPDPALAAMPEAAGLPAWLLRAGIHWIKGHGSCRGNALADWHARIAAGGEATAPLS